MMQRKAGDREMEAGDRKGRAQEQKPSRSRLPRDSFLYSRLVPDILLDMALLTAILILVAAGVL